MKQLILKPELHKFQTCKEFAKEFELGEDDLILTNEYIFNPYFKELNLPVKQFSKKNSVQVNQQTLWLMQLLMKPQNILSKE